jgi:uncharacterized paraquat-inducible protein A
MMMGLGFWIMLLLVAVPVVLIVRLVFLMLRPTLWKLGAQTTASPKPRGPGHGSSACSHCGTQLQVEWAQCPSCGAPANG